MRKTAIRLFLIAGVFLATPVGVHADEPGSLRLPLPEGTRVKTADDPRVYVVDRGRLRYLTGEAYHRLWRDFGGILTVAGIPPDLVGEELGKGTRLVTRVGTTELWLIENARVRRRIASLSVIRAWRLAVDLATEVPAAVLEAFPEGDAVDVPASTPDGAGPPKQPTWGGVPLEEWWHRYLAPGPVPKPADLALADAGPHAPGLVEELRLAARDENPVVRKRAVRLAGTVGPVVLDTLLRALRDPEPRVRLAAMVSAGAIGPAAAPAAPELVAILGGPERSGSDRADAIAALGRIGSAAPEAVPALVRLLADDGLCYAARRALLAIGRPALPAIRAAREDPDRRIPALVLLGTLAPRDPEVLSDLVALLSNPKWGRVAAQLLDGRDDLTEEARRALERWCDEHGLSHGVGYLRAAGRRDPAYPDTPAGARATAYRARIREAAAAGKVAPAFRAALADPVWWVRRAGVEALPGGDAAFAAAAEALRPALADPDLAVREAAFRAYARMGPVAVPALAPVLADGAPDARWRAARALESLAQSGVADAISAVAALRDDSDPALVAIALRARRDAMR